MRGTVALPRCLGRNSERARPDGARAEPRAARAPAPARARPRTRHARARAGRPAARAGRRVDLRQPLVADRRLPARAAHARARATHGRPGKHVAQHAPPRLRPRAPAVSGGSPGVAAGMAGARLEARLLGIGAPTCRACGTEDAGGTPTVRRARGSAGRRQIPGDGAQHAKRAADGPAGRRLGVPRPRSLRAGGTVARDGCGGYRRRGSAISSGAISRRSGRRP